MNLYIRFSCLSSIHWSYCTTKTDTYFLFYFFFLTEFFFKLQASFAGEGAECGDAGVVGCDEEDLSVPHVLPTGVTSQYNPLRRHSRSTAPRHSTSHPAADLYTPGNYTMYLTPFNPLVPSAHKSARIAKNSLLKSEGIIKKMSVATMSR